MAKTLPRAFSKRPTTPIHTAKDNDTHRDVYSPLSAGITHTVEDTSEHVSPLAAPTRDDTPRRVHNDVTAPHLTQRTTTQVAPAIPRRVHTPPVVDTPKAPVKKATSKTATLRAGTHVVTDQDRRILTAVDWMHQATIMHIAVAVGNTRDNLSKRLKVLIKRGYLYESKSEAMTLYGITDKGIQMLGKNHRNTRFIAASGMAHRNKINSIVTRYKLGSTEFNSLIERDADLAERDVDLKNKGVERYNKMLANEQERIQQIPEGMRTEEDHKQLKLKPRSFKQTKPRPETFVSGGRSIWFTEQPQVCHAERIIYRDINLNGEDYCRRDFTSEMEAFLNSGSMPVRQVSNLYTVNDEERASLEALVDGKMWLFKHWNHEGKFDKQHTPDGVIVLPNIHQADGSITPGSWWIEMEENAKKLPEIMRVLMQAIDHPGIQGVIYFTDTKAIANLVKRAKVQVVSRLVMESKDYRSTREQKEALAQQIVDSSVIISKTPLVNAHRNNGHGFWG